jgi:hypothetical protein
VQDLILYLNSATLFEYSVFILCFIFSEKRVEVSPLFLNPLLLKTVGLQKGLDKMAVEEREVCRILWCKQIQLWMFRCKLNPF